MRLLIDVDSILPPKILPLVFFWAPGSLLDTYLHRKRWFAQSHTQTNGKTTKMTPRRPSKTTQDSSKTVLEGDFLHFKNRLIFSFVLGVILLHVASPNASLLAPFWRAKSVNKLNPPLTQNHSIRPLAPFRARKFVLCLSGWGANYNDLVNCCFVTCSENISLQWFWQ